MIQVNQKVRNNKGQEGVIIRIITKSTGYVEVQYEGYSKKEMAFNLTDENGNQLKKSPKKSEPKTASQLQKVIDQLMTVNGMLKDRNSLGFQIWNEKVCAIWAVAREKGNEFIINVSSSCNKYGKVSEKQAYCLAKFAIENNIKF